MVTRQKNQWINSINIVFYQQHEDLKESNLKAFKIHNICSIYFIQVLKSIFFFLKETVLTTLLNNQETLLITPSEHSGKLLTLAASSRNHHHSLLARRKLVNLTLVSFSTSAAVIWSLPSLGPTFISSIMTTLTWPEQLPLSQHSNLTNGKELLAIHCSPVMNRSTDFRNSS